MKKVRLARFNGLVNTAKKYDPTSEEPMSGIAVAEALSGVSGGSGEKPWQLLNNITLTEAVNRIDDGLFDTTYDEIWVEGTIIGDTDFGATAKVALFCVACNQRGTIHTEYVSGGIVNGGTYYLRAHAYKTPSNCLVVDTLIASNYYVSKTPNQTAGIKTTYGGFDRCVFTIQTEGGNGIRFGAGTKIKVWGR